MHRRRSQQYGGMGGPSGSGSVNWRNADDRASIIYHHAEGYNKAMFIRSMLPRLNYIAQLNTELANDYRQQMYDHSGDTSTEFAKLKGDIMAAYMHYGGTDVLSGGLKLGSTYVDPRTRPNYDSERKKYDDINRIYSGYLNTDEKRPYRAILVDDMEPKLKAIHKKNPDLANQLIDLANKTRTIDLYRVVDKVSDEYNKLHGLPTISEQEMKAILLERKRILQREIAIRGLPGVF